MRLRDLLDKPELGLELMSGTDEQIDRSLRWVCTTDLLDPGRYLSGGELVISGLLWRREPEDSERFVANITAAGASALAVGTAGESNTVPGDLVEACRRHDLPLVWVAAEVAFAQITEQVVGAVTVGREAQLAGDAGPAAPAAQRLRRRSATCRTWPGSWARRPDWPAGSSPRPAGTSCLATRRCRTPTWTG